MSRQRCQPLVSCAELADQLGESTLIIIDCRHELRDPAAGRRAFHEGHLPGARHAHLDIDLARAPGPADGRHPLPTIDAFVAALRRLGVSNDSWVVVYDDCSGAMAARLWWMLRWLGHERVSVLDGGLAAWIAQGRPLEREADGGAPGDFVPATVHDEWVVTTSELQGLLELDRIALLDARSAERFDGILEPIDPVAGHVPGAKNLPFTAQLDEQGLFVSADQLKALFENSVGPGAGEQIVTMCGSGVTACHLLLGLSAAGLGEGRLYVGSWSEWIRDGLRPVASGSAD